MSLKSIAKGLLNSVFVVVNLPVLLMYFAFCTIFNRDNVFSSFSELYSLFPGQVGVYLRRNFYRFAMRSCGSNVVVGFGTLFSHQGVELGDNVYIGPQCNIGLCSIGPETLIGSGVHILSGKNQHNFDDPNLPLREQGGVFQKITIGDNCWVGNQATLMASIGSRAVIGAGAIVTKTVPDRHTAVSSNTVSVRPMSAR